MGFPEWQQQMRGEATLIHAGILTGPRADTSARMRPSRDPSAVNRDDNGNLPRTRTCKAVDKLERPPQEVSDFKCRCQFGYVQVPPDGQKDHFARVVTSFEWIARRDWHRSTVSAGGAQSSQWKRA
jgi:hypothetical protein